MVMGDYKLYHGDCLDIMPQLNFDAIITDPPYPDYHVELYGKVDISWLENYDCRQFVFWSAKAPFPLDYTAIHVWDKVIGVGSMYERIFERNGQGQYKLFRAHPITCEYIATRSGEVWTGHKSQKPLFLMRKLIEEISNHKDIILDPYAGSGSTGVAAIELGRRFIGIEINKEYFDTAKDRIEQASLQPLLFTEEKPEVAEQSNLM